VKGTITVLLGFRLRYFLAPFAGHIEAQLNDIAECFLIFTSSYNDYIVSIALAKYTSAGQSVQQLVYQQDPKERREDTPLVATPCGRYCGRLSSYSGHGSPRCQ